MIEDDPHIIPRLRDFLSLINAQVPHAKAAKNILKIIDRRVSSHIYIAAIG